MLQDIDDVDWMLQPALTPALQAVADGGFVFDAVIRPQHLPRLRALCRRRPTLAVVIDHGAKADIARGTWQPWPTNSPARPTKHRRIASCRACSPRPAPAPLADAVQPWARYLLDVFGTARMLWGSDWSVLEVAVSYRAWWQQSQTVLSPLTATERAAVLGGNAQRVYRP
jgi:L-fuconolactonase